MLHTSGIGSVIQGFLVHSYPVGGTAILGLEDLRPSMAFSQLHRITLDLWSRVNLTDNELLESASAWPHLERLAINENSGWNTTGGITPNGLLQLLETHPSLTLITLVIDTRGYIELLPGHSLASLRSSLPFLFVINVLDSAIEEESVPAITAFFASIMPRFNFSLRAWRTDGAEDSPHYEVFIDRWNDVCKGAGAIIPLCWRL